MNYLNVENISKSYGEVTLFENISFSIHKGQKIAFIAKNGTGKTSILKIISAEDTSDSGEITCRKNIVISFLSQDPKLDENLTIEESIFNSNNPVLKVIENYEKALLNSRLFFIHFSVFSFTLTLPMEICISRSVTRVES